MRISASPMSITQVWKSGIPMMPSKGVRMSPTSEVMMAPNAAPMTTATARSTMLPLKMKARNSLIIASLL